MSVVDVYVDGVKALDDVAFRENSGFISLPTTNQVSIGIKDKDAASTDADLLTIPYTPTMGSTEILIASGVVNPTKYAANPDGKSINAGAIVIGNAKFEADDNTKVAFNVFHGSPDAPTVDVVVRGTTLAFDDLAYGESSAYIEVPASQYIVDLYDETRTTVLGTYDVDLEGGEGSAFTVYASGFLSPDDNEDGPAFGLYAAVQPEGTDVKSEGIAIPTITTAMVQIIHNAADPMADEVDIYLDGQAVAALDNFKFRSATPFIPLPANTDIEIGVAPGNSGSSEDILEKFNFNLLAGEMYTVVANGVLDPGKFATNPDMKMTGFNLWATSGKMMSDDENKIALRVIHGATDAPTVDVQVRGADLTLVQDASYGDITDFFEVDPMAYRLDLTDASGSQVLMTFDVDLDGTAGGVGTILASGFLSPENNEDGASFTLIAVLPDGTVLPLMPVTTAKVQIIHNAADPAASEVDIYLDGEAVGALDNFAFRTATGYIDLPANRQIKIGVAPGTSTSYDDTLATFGFNLLAGETYSVIANGVVGEGFEENPDARNIGFGLWATSAKMMPEKAEEFEFKIVHGATDAPTVDVDVDGAMLKLADDAAYGDITDYIAVAPSKYRLNVMTADGMTKVAAFDADLSTLAGKTGMVLASGFYNNTNTNQADNTFGLYAVLPEGGAFVAFDMLVGLEERMNTADVALFPNPATASLYISTGDEAITGYEMVSTTGQVVARLDGAQSQVMTIDVASLPTGYYLLSVHTNSGIAQHKVMITE